MEKEKKVFSTIGLAIAVTTIVVGIVQSILMGVIKVAMPSVSSGKWMSYILVSVLYFIGLPIFFYVVKYIPNSEKKESRKLSVKEVIIFFFISYAALIIFNQFTMGFMHLVSLVKGTAVTNPLQSMVGKSSLLATFLFAGIFSPIIEETLFRGIMLNKLRCYGDRIAIITTALLFGLFHANFSQFFYATAIGLVFAYVAVKTGTIKYTIILHMMVNIMGSVVPILASKNAVTENVFDWIVIIFTILGVLFVIIAIVKKKILLSPAEIQIENGQVFKTTCLNFGMIFNLIINLTSMIYYLCV